MSKALVGPKLPSQFPHPAQDSFERSLWSVTATSPARYEALTGDHTTDVAVVGAGFTGLCTALALAEQGVDVTIVDAMEPGFGASGRNGGQVIPMSKFNPDELVERYGDTVGKGMVEMFAASSEAVFGAIKTHGIECEADRGGWVQAAHADSAVPILQGHFRQMRSRGADVEWLDKEAMHAALGTRSYVAGWIHRDAGTIQPLSYARGLARVASAKGARIHSHTFVRKLERIDNRWLLRTPQGSLRARQVVLAGNAYLNDLWPELKQSFVPVFAMQIATDPIPADTAKTILSGTSCVSDTKRLLTYFRKDAAGRFVIGSRGPFTANPAASDARSLLLSARKTFPALESVDFPYRWAGRIAVTTDHVPHLHNPAPGLWAALGYNGRGVAMASLMGAVLARACNSAPAHSPRYPVSAVNAIPFHAFHRAGVHAMVAYYRLLDAISGGRNP